MKMQEILENVKIRAGEDLIDSINKSSKRVYFTIKKSALLKIAKYLFKDINSRFITASGVDTRKTVEILYHFSIDDIGLIVTLRVILEKACLEVESLTGLMKCAEWIEREMHEMLGVDFKGHPNLKHLLLKDDWPEGKYPLRRDV